MATSPANDAALPHLRAIAYRITALQSIELVRYVPHLAFQLAPCKSILTSPQPASSDAAATVHQIKTRVSSLLQDRTEESRFAGVALVKCLIELGGWEILHSSGSWVRSMIGILGRPSHATVTKRMCMLALVRIFQLTHEYDNLVREITTPNLPSYVTACLNNLNRKDGQSWTAKQESLLGAMLQSWAELMPKHPTIFRPFISQIRRVLSPIVATSSVKAEHEREYSPETREAARRVHVLLHGSATKNGDLEDRESGITTILREAQITTRRLFKSLYGDEESRIRIMPGHANGTDHNDVEEATTMDLIRQVELLESYITTSNAKSSALPIGAIISLMRTISSASMHGTKSDSRITKNARQALLIDLPLLHTTALQVILSVLRRFKNNSMAVARDIMECAVIILENNPKNVTMRPLIYTVTETAVWLAGYDLNDKTSRILHPVILQCCKDLLPAEPETVVRTTAKNGKPIASSINPNALIGSTSKTNVHVLQVPALNATAHSLLQGLFTNLRATALPASLRTEMERVAIVTRSADALVGSVLNPRPGTASLLPFAANLIPQEMALESIIRPRLPFIQGGRPVDDEEEEGDEIMADVESGNKPSQWGVVHDPESDESAAIVDSDLDKKRLLDNVEPEVPFKRARLDLDAYMPPVKAMIIQPADTVTVPVISQPAELDAEDLHHVASAVGSEAEAADREVTVNEAANSDDTDDDDDFEMPPLVLDPRVL